MGFPVTLKVRVMILRSDICMCKVETCLLTLGVGKTGTSENEMTQAYFSKPGHRRMCQETFLFVYT